MSAETSITRSLEKIDFADRFIDQLPQRYQRVARSQRRSSCQVRASRGKLVDRRRFYVGASLPSIDFADTTAVFAKIGSDVVLPVPSRDHPLNNRDFTVVQSHFDPHWLKLRDYARNSALSERAGV